jgi:hypothetical protein
MSRTATVIVPSNIDAALSGVTRIELTARRAKAYGMDPSRAPHVLNRRTGDGTGTMPFRDLAALIRTTGTRAE